MRATGLILVMALAGANPVFAGSHGDDKPGKVQRQHMFAHKMLDGMDGDGDGTVSESEFIDAHRERFSRMDSDGDGRLSKEEVAGHHREMRERRQQMREERAGGPEGN